MIYEKKDSYEQNLCDYFYFSSPNDFTVILYGNNGMSEVDAYLAGLFDGEGCVSYTRRPQLRKGKPKAYLFWVIRMEVNMIDKPTIEFIHNSFGCGTINLRPKMEHQNYDQYRWRCTHRDAFQCAKRIFPYSITKKEKLNNIIKHYEVKDSRSL